MAKKQIDKCLNCVSRDQSIIDGRPYCTDDKELRDIDDLYAKPEWCPLESSEEEEG